MAGVATSNVLCWEADWPQMCCPRGDDSRRTSHAHRGVFRPRPRADEPVARPARHSRLRPAIAAMRHVGGAELRRLHDCQVTCGFRIETPPDARGGRRIGAVASNPARRSTRRRPRNRRSTPRGDSTGPNPRRVVHDRHEKRRQIRATRRQGPGRYPAVSDDGAN